MDGEHTLHVDSQTMRQLTTYRHVPAGAPKKVREPTTDCGSSGGEKFLGSELTGSSGEWNLSRSVLQSCTTKSCTAIGPSG